MRRLLATIVSGTLATLVAAADAPVLAQFTIADGQRLAQHFQAGVFGRLWSDPAMVPLRTRLDSMMPMIEEELGFAPLALTESLTSAQATLFGLPAAAGADEITAYKRSPGFSIQAGLGKLAAQVFAKLKESGGEPTVVLGAAEAVSLPGKQAILARIGDLLMMGSSAKRLIPGVIAPSPHDLTFRFNGQSIAETARLAMTPEEAKKAEGMLKALHRFLVPATAHIDFAPTHVASRFEAKTTLPFLTPVDLSLCARLPATAYSVYALGFDGGTLWVDLIAPLLAATAVNQGTTTEQLLEVADQQLVALGSTATFKGLISGLRGTMLVAQTPGAPFPGYTIGIPRSPAFDELVGILLKQIGNDLPAEGEATPLAIPNLPLPVSLVRDRGHWLLSSDTALASAWSSTADGGWMTSPLGKLASAKTGTGALMVAVSDTAAELRAVQGYVGMGLGSLPLEPKEKQAVMRGFSSLIANAGLSHEVLQQRGEMLVSEGQSMLGGSGLMVAAVVAAIAIPNLLESRTTSNEAAAAATLKSGIFPAQIQFQAGGYRDLDGDHVGEYGFLSELAGGPIAGQKADLRVNLLMPAERWMDAAPQSNGYHYAIYLPDGKNGAYGADQPNPPKGAAINEGERCFVAYAWPIDGDSGRKAFALSFNGVVYATPAADLGGEAPAWNALFGGDDSGWQDAPTWAPYRK